MVNHYTKSETLLSKVVIVITLNVEIKSALDVIVITHLSKELNNMAKNELTIKERLLALIEQSSNIKLYIAGDNGESLGGELNDMVLKEDGTLELWDNSPGYEI